MHRIGRVVTFCACAAIVPALAQKPMSSFMSAVGILNVRYDDCYIKKDAVCMAGLYAADGELISPDGEIVHGRTALEAYYRKCFASGATSHHIVLLEAHLRGDVGYSVASFTVSVPPRTEQGHIAAFYEGDETGWHYVLVQPSVKPEH